MATSLRFLVFFGTLSLVVVLGHIYLYRRLFRDTAKHPGWRLAGVGVMAFLASLIIGWRLLPSVLPQAVASAFTKLGWLWMGVATYLLLAVLSLGGVRKLMGWLKRRRVAEPAPVDEERR